MRIKSVSEFGKNASTRDGYFKECLDCKDENYHRRRARKNQNTWNGGMHVCCRCGMQKPTYEFPKLRNKRTDSVYCSSCISDWVRKKLLRFEMEREKKGWPIKKRCKKCIRILPSDKFHLDRRIRDGMADKCIDCVNEWHDQWVEKNIKKHQRRKKKKTDLKECSVCHELKPYTCFTLDKSTLDGYDAQCIVCIKRIREENVNIWANQRTKKGKVLKELKCRICNRVLPIEMFSRDKERKKGYYNYCKDCHKQREKEAEKHWKRKRQQASFEFSLNVVTEKKCKICGKVLPISMFWNRQASKDGHNHYCKDCESKKIKERNKRLKEQGFPKELIHDEKRCVKCGRVLPQRMFSRNSLASDGLNAHCKECYSEYYKSYYSRPEIKQKQRDYNRLPEVMERRRQSAKAYYYRKKNMSKS
jgi:hypothetical protein